MGSEMCIRDRHKPVLVCEFQPSFILGSERQHSSNRESIVEVEGGINAIDKGLNLAAVGTIFGAGATAIGVGDRAGGSTATHGFVAVQSYGGVQLRYAGAGFDRVDAAVFPRGATL